MCARAPESIFAAIYHFGERFTGAHPEIKNHDTQPFSDDSRTETI